VTCAVVPAAKRVFHCAKYARFSKQPPQQWGEGGKWILGRGKEVPADPVDREDGVT